MTWRSGKGRGRAGSAHRPRHECALLRAWPVTGAVRPGLSGTDDNIQHNKGLI